MNVALAIQIADPSRGGAERYTTDLARQLTRRGLEVAVLAQHFGELPDGVEKVALESRGATRLLRYESFLDALDTHVARRRYDIVHAMTPVRACDIYHPHAGLAAEALRSGHEKHRGAWRRSLSRMGNLLNRKRRRFASVERELLEGVRPPVVLCLSDYIGRLVRKHYRLPDDRMVRLLNGIDLQRFDPGKGEDSSGELRSRLGIRESATVALIIAQDYRRKGLREAVLAAARIDELTLVVVGKERPGTYRRLAREHRVSERVIFTGATSDPRPFYRAADLFVLPTRHDPCSLVVLEALAMGLPVISTVFNGACEAMRDGEHGFILEDPADIDALERSLRALMDPARRSAMGRACRELRQEISQERHVDRLLEIYRRVSEGRAEESVGESARDARLKPQRMGRPRGTESRG